MSSTVALVLLRLYRVGQKNFQTAYVNWFFKPLLLQLDIFFFVFFAQTHQWLFFQKALTSHNESSLKRILLANFFTQLLYRLVKSVISHSFLTLSETKVENHKKSFGLNYTLFLIYRKVLIMEQSLFIFQQSQTSQTGVLLLLSVLSRLYHLR